MSSQPGWHPDPVPPTPGQPPQLRYWDGTRWTEHVAPAQDAGQADSSSSGQPAPYAGTYGGAPAQASPYGASPASPYGATTASTTTPDGVALAGWWQRVLALVIDAVIVGIISALVALPWVRELGSAYQDWFRDAVDSANTGATVDTSSLLSEVRHPLLVIQLIGLGVNAVYWMGFLAWKQATPGKLVLGLRVRLRERPGPMPFTTVLIRWAMQHGLGVIGLVPLVGAFFSLYKLLDYLWPLWDPHKQALHDKVAKTNVVRTR